MWIRKSKKNSAARGIRTPDLGIMSPAPYSNPNSEIKTNGDDSNFSTPTRVLSETSLPLEEIKDGDMLPSNAGYSAAQFIKSRESDFLKSNPASKPKTMKTYYDKIVKMDWLRVPDDLKENGDKINRSTKDGVDALFKYQEKWNKKESDRTFNGYRRADYKDLVMPHVSNKKGSRKSEKTNELVEYPDVVSKTMELLPYDVQMFFLMTAYSGARTTQLYRLFEAPLKIRKKDGFFLIDAGEVGQGHKLATYFFFPDFMLPVVENFKILRGMDRKDPETAYNDIVNDNSTIIDKTLPCNLSSLRKFAKGVLNKADVDDNAGEYTQGRIPPGTGARNYDNLRVKAIDQYPKTLGMWEELVPVPEWMLTAAGIKEKMKLVDPSTGKKTEGRMKRPQPAKSPGRSQLTKEKRDWIIRLHKEGTTLRDIAKITSSGRETVSKVVKEYAG